MGALTFGLGAFASGTWNASSVSLGGGHPLHGGDSEGVMDVLL